MHKQDPRFDAQMSVAAYQLRSILCVPLKLKDDLIGVLYVDNRAHAGIFKENDLDLISGFADQAAVAIDSARLFEDLQESHRELEKAYQATWKAGCVPWICVTRKRKDIHNA